MLNLGLRETQDTIEKIGIQKAVEKALEAQIIIFIIDATQSLDTQLKELELLKEKGLKEPLLVCLLYTSDAADE